MLKLSKFILVTYLLLTGITLPFILYKIYEINIKDDYIFGNNPIEVVKIFSLSENSNMQRNNDTGFFSIVKKMYNTKTTSMEGTRYEYYLLDKTHSYSENIDVFFFCKNNKKCIALYYQEQNRLIFYQTENSHIFSRTTFLNFDLNDFLSKEQIFKEVRSSITKLLARHIYYGDY